jgi:hypothetical protein
MPVQLCLIMFLGWMRAGKDYQRVDSVFNAFERIPATDVRCDAESALARCECEQ